MNPLYQDVGVLVEPELDLAFGKDENDFACRVHISNHCCEKGYFIYAEGTEYGGIVDSIEVDTASDSVTYSGRSWQGMLESRVILPLQEGEGGGGSRLPEGYTELTYIQSTGTQYVDTGLVPTPTTRVEIEVMPLNTTSVIFGAGWENDGFILTNWTESSFFNSLGTSTRPPQQSLTEKNVIVCEPSFSIVNGVTTPVTTTTPNTTAYNIFLFWAGSRQNAGFMGVMRLYSCKFYENGALVRDYVPCKTESGDIGMYDLLNGVFYENSGTGTFIPGEVVASEDSGGVDNPFDVTIETETSSGVSNVNRHLVISGDAHACIAYMLDRVGLPAALFTAAKDAAGVNITKYQFRRYTDAYEGLCDMLASVGMRMQITHVDGVVTLSAAEKYDYSQDEEFESELVDFTSKTHYNKVNHLICLGTGEMENRLVVHLYADEKGKISQTQTFFGIDEYVDTYSDTSVETMDDLIANGTDAFKGLLTSDEITVDFDYDSDSYYIGDIVGSYDSKTGISVSAEITKKIVTVKNGMVNISYQVG